jgi:hypothetical protein
MPKTPIHRLRLARNSTLKAIKRAEILLTLYSERLTKIETAIHQIAPDAPLSGTVQKPNPLFDRGEVTRLVLDSLRLAECPMSVLEIALWVLGVKNVVFPSPPLRRATRRQVGQALLNQRKRGITDKLGSGQRSKWTLVADYK